jgi:hypothetical protein
VNDQKGGTYSWFEFSGFNTANENHTFDGFMRAHFICSKNTSTSSRDVIVRIRYKSSSDVVPVCYFAFHQLGVTQKYGSAYGDSEFNVTAKNATDGSTYTSQPIVLNDGKLACNFDVESNTTWTVSVYRTDSNYIIGDNNMTSTTIGVQSDVFNGTGNQTVKLNSRAINTDLVPWYFVVQFKSSDDSKEPIEMHIKVNPVLDETVAMHLYCGPFA